VAIGGDREIALAALREGLSWPDGMAPIEHILDEISRLAVESEAARVAIEPWLEVASPTLRASAACALALCGGDAERATLLYVQALRDGAAPMEVSKPTGGTPFSVSVFRDLLASTDPDERHLGAVTLFNLGADAAPALDDLRRLCADTPPGQASFITWVVKHVEYEVERDR